MRRFVCFIAFLLLLSGGNASGRAEHLSAGEISLFAKCVRSLSWNMLGSQQFATGDRVTVKYLFTRKGAPRDKQNLYVAFMDQRGDFGRLFLFQKFQDGWWVVNDADFGTKPRWKLTSEPLGGVNTASLMNEALSEMQRRRGAEILKLAPIEKQPPGCSTYLQR